MAMLGSKQIHMVYNDRRGCGVEEIIEQNNLKGEYMKVVAYKRASFNEIASSAKEHLKRHDEVYMVGVTTEVTTKNSFTKQISFEWGQNLDLQNHLVNLLNQVNDRLKIYYPASKVVFCPLIGTDLTRVVNSHPVSAEDKITVDNAIWEFNSQVLRVNEERETFFPALHQ